MEVKAGYKQTDAGVIPEDWGAGRVGDLIGKIDSGLSRRLQVQDIGIPVLISGNIQDNRLVTDELRYWYEEDPQGANIDDYVLDDGDLLLCFINSISQIGKSCIFRDLGRPVIYTTNLFRIVTSKRCVTEFAHSLISSTEFQRALQLVVKPAVNQASFTKPDFLRICVGIPPVDEQKVIAEALSDADALIDSLEQLLAKKRQHKRGAMQDLLTGKKRLPGFSGEWDVNRLGDCFALVSTRNTELNDTVVTISAQQGFVRQEEFFKKRVASLVLENYYLIERGHFAYNRSYSNGYPFGAIKRLTTYDKGVVTTLYICFALKPEAASDPTFYEHYFEAGLLNSGLSTVTNVGGRAHGLLNITKEDFFCREIKRPPLPEQNAIAIILSDMDTDIAALEAKLDKTRQLKQGMMQELLTGRIRLV